MITKEKHFTDTETVIRDFFKLNGKIIKIKKNEYLFNEGIRATKLYMVVQGNIQINKNNSDGKEMMLSIVGKNELFGDFTLFHPKAIHTTNAKAMENSVVYAVENEKIETQILKGSNFTVELIKLFNLYQKRSEFKLRDFVLYGKKGALYSILIRLSNDFGVMKDDGILIDIKLTNQDLGNFCGMTRESVSRMLAELKYNDIVSSVDGKIIIHDINFIKKEISCEECPLEVCSIFS